MAAFFWYASFPNSRIKPRPSTSVAFTEQITVSDYGQPLTRIIEADVNRTYMLVENFSNSKEIFYIYATTSLVDPSSVATFGVVNQLLYNSGSGTLYQKQDDGTTTNWVAVNIQDVGEKIFPKQTASLDSPQDVYAAVNSAAPITVVVGVDVGAG